MKYLLISLLFAVTSPIAAQLADAARFDTLTTDGAWCWFADPRAIYHKGEKEQTYLSWITTDGDIMIAAYNHKTGEMTQQCIHKGLQSDDHANPVIFIRKDGRLIVFYSKHFDTVMHRVISINPEDITSWGPEYTFGDNVTYPYPFQVGNDILIFYRGDADWHPTMAVSHDNGATFTSVQKFIVGGGQRPYTRFAQDKKGAIHIAFTTGHPRNEPTNKIFYACFKKGAFYKADGSLIKPYTGSETALNIDADQADVVYAADKGKGWIWDIAVGKDGKPVLVYAAFPTDTQHDYYYARWTGKRWENHLIEHSGTWFPQTPAGRTEPEPNYSGGIYLDPSNPKVVYLSKQVNGVFEIYRYTTRDNGATWEQAAITTNTPAGLVNVRPVVPRHRKAGYFDVVWMRGTYQFYANQQYHTGLMFAGKAKKRPLERLKLSETQLDLLEGTSYQLNVSCVPFLTPDKRVAWQSSDETVLTVKEGLVKALKPGKASVTVSGSNGIMATCAVTVTEPHYLTNACFDFGTADSPLSPGALRVTESSRPTTTYGWLSPVLSRDRGHGQSDDVRDFNMGGEPTVFRVYVTNGDYRLTFKQGDKAYRHDKMTVKVNGRVVMQDMTVEAGALLTQTVDVVVSSNRLDIEFSRQGTDPNWVINALTIEPLKKTVNPSEAIHGEALSAYLMTYFKDDTHGLYFAVSDDGYTFTDVNNGQPVIAGDTIAEQKGIRDPHIMRGPDGCFYLAMTDLHIYGKQKGYRDTEWERPGELYDWGNNRGFVLMKSNDLINWSHTVLDIHKAYPEYDLGCAWAPELIYDPDKDRIMIYFTMRKGKGRTKLYYAYMNEAFNALETAPELLFEYPDSTKQILDADITRLPDGRYAMMYVAQENPGGIKLAFSDHINKGYVYREGQVDYERGSCEAPNVWKRLGEDKWVLMYDIFSVRPHNFGFAETSDFIHYTNLGHFDQGVMRRTNFAIQKHGAVIHLTKSEAERLKTWYQQKKR